MPQNRNREKKTKPIKNKREGYTGERDKKNKEHAIRKANKKRGKECSMKKLLMQRCLAYSSQELSTLKNSIYQKMKSIISTTEK